MKEFDLIVIGSGPGGQRAAIRSAKFGKRVALVESEPQFGGACIHTGTIPSKSLRESIYNLYSFRMGRSAKSRKELKHETTFTDLAARKDRIVASENELIGHQLRSNGISVYHGFGSFVTPNRIKVQTDMGGEIFLDGKFIIIATGSKPVRPKNIPFDDMTICDSDSILKLKQIPETLTVIGGGVIGCEYASMFSALGVDVRLVEKKGDIIPFIDQEICEALKKAMIAQGCQFHLGEELSKIRKVDGLVETELKSGKVIKSEVALYCMGREAQTTKLNLEPIGIKPDARGLLTVNKSYQTSVPNIYAVGDIIGFPSLASSAFEQGRLAACHAFGDNHDPFPDEFPYGIYTIPEISTVGKSEEELQEEKIEYAVGRAEYLETARGQILSDSTGLLKICFCKKTLKILGIHVIGNSATELVHLGQMVMILNGDMNTLVKNIFNYPTLAEAYKIAAFNGLNKIK